MKQPGRWFDLLYNVTSRISSYAIAVAAACLLIMALLITVDVSLRYIWRSPILGSDQIAAYLLVALLFLGVAYAMKAKAHIRIDILTARLPQKINHVLEAICYAVAIIATGIFLWHSLWMVITSYEVGSNLIGSLVVPAWIPQLFVPLGFGFLLLQMIAEFLLKIMPRV